MFLGAAALGTSTLAVVAGPVHAALLEVGAGKPFAAIQAAVDAAQPGDTVLVYPGVYTDAQTYEFAGTRSTLVHIKKSGTEAAPITLKAAGPDVALDGGGTTTNCVWGRDLAYVVVVGFECRNVDVRIGRTAGLSGAIHFYKSRFITVSGNRLHDVAQTDYENEPIIGLQETSDSVIKNNRVSARSIGITITQSPTTTIEGNEIDGNDRGTADCADLGAPQHANGIYLTNNSPYSIVTRNYIHDYAHSAIQIRDSVQVRFDRNIVYNGHGARVNGCQSWGVVLRDWDTTGPGPDEDDRHRVFNNVIDTSTYGFTVVAQDNSVFENNIVMNVGSVFLDARWSASGVKPASMGLLFDYNIYYNYGKLYDDFTDADCYGGCPDTGYTDGGHNLVGVNPGLVASGARPLPYYRLAAGSPAIDAADPATPPGNDFAGVVVPLGPRADIGALEFVVGADSIPPAAPSNLTVQ
jgi:parallel beta-helix repeat protein